MASVITSLTILDEMWIFVISEPIFIVSSWPSYLCRRTLIKQQHWQKWKQIERRFVDFKCWGGDDFCIPEMPHQLFRWAERQCGRDTRLPGNKDRFPSSSIQLWTNMHWRTGIVRQTPQIAEVSPIYKLYAKFTDFSSQTTFSIKMAGTTWMLLEEKKNRGFEDQQIGHLILFFIFKTTVKCYMMQNLHQNTYSQD